MSLDRTAAAATLPDRIAFLGLGLIGGSIAMALREAGYAGELVAWTPDGRGPAEASRRGLATAASAVEAALEGSGLVVLAGPPLSVVALLSDLAGPLRAGLADGATITDVASTKAQIVRNADAYGLPFVGGHPMAGRESTGVDSASGDLFDGRPWVVVPATGARPIDIERVRALATAVGAEPRELDAEAHDRAVAAISHLPLVLAAALVESVAGDRGQGTWGTARDLTAGGWESMTRLAKGDPGMGAGILATNAGPVLDQLRAFREVLDTWIDLLDPAMRGGGDPVWIRTELQRARDTLMSGRE